MRNLTPFAAMCMPFMTPNNLEAALIIVAGRFDLPRPGERAGPSISEEQAMPPLEDEYHGDASRSSLRWEGLGSCPRAGTDIHVQAEAWTARGRPATETVIEVRVGGCRRAAIVYGDREWRQAFTGLRPSAPRVFEHMSVVYERCFGGFVQGARGATRAACERNPVGRGLVQSRRSAAGQALPNIEDPEHLIQDPSDLPQPAGFGPIPRHWEPRRALAGTYDEIWARTRAPLWPDDLDPRFFRAAPAALQASEHLRGHEPVNLVGLHPDGVIAFPVPHQRLVAKLRTAEDTLRLPLPLDTLAIDTLNMTLTMIWRAQVIMHPNIFILDEIIVRALSEREQSRS